MNADTQIIPLARSHVYGFLAHAFADPMDSQLHELRERLPLLEASLTVLDDPGSLNAAQRWGKALGRLDDDAALQNMYQRCFGHGISKDCPPYEAEYGQAHIFQISQCLADIAGFYRAFGLDLKGNFHDRVDHICAELDFMQWLCLKEAHAHSSRSAKHLSLCEDAQNAFLRDHLGRWALSFTARLQSVAEGSCYGIAAALLTAFIRTEARALGVEPTAELPLNEADMPRRDATADCTACLATAAPVNLVKR